MSRRRVIVVPGYGGPDKNWFPWLKGKLEAGGIEAKVLALHNPENPILEEWVGKLKEAVGEASHNAYIVGYSLGAITILRYLESLPEGQQVCGVVLVAGFSKPIPDYKNWDKLKNFF